MFCMFMNIFCRRVYCPNKCTKLMNVQGPLLDKKTNELAMVVKDIRALRDSFEP